MGDLGPLAQLLDATLDPKQNKQGQILRYICMDTD